LGANCSFETPSDRFIKYNHRRGTIEEITKKRIDRNYQNVKATEDFEK